MKQIIFSIFCSAAISLLVSGCKSGAKKKPHASFNANHALQDSLNSDPNALLTAYPLTKPNTPLLSLVARDFGLPRDPDKQPSILPHSWLPAPDTTYAVQGLSKDSEIDGHRMFYHRRFSLFGDELLYPLSKIKRSNSCFILLTEVESVPFMSIWIHLFSPDIGIITGLRLAQQEETGEVQSTLQDDWTLKWVALEVESEPTSDPELSKHRFFTALLQIDTNCTLRLKSVDSSEVLR